MDNHRNHSQHEEAQTCDSTLKPESKDSASIKNEEAALTFPDKKSESIASIQTTFISKDTEHKISAAEIGTLKEQMQTIQEQLNEQKKILQHVDRHTLQFLKRYESQFNSMIKKELQKESKNSYHQHILRHPHLTAYYIMFFSILEGTHSACNGIFSGYLANGKKELADYALDGLNKLAGIVPSGSFLMQIFTGGATALRTQKNARFVEKIINFFAKYETVDEFIRDLARQLTLVQAQTLPELALKSPKTFAEKAKGKARKIKNWMLADGSDDPIKTKAREDCEKLLKTISEDKEGDFAKVVTVDHCINTILGAEFKRAPLPKIIIPTNSDDTPIADSQTTAKEAEEVRRSSAEKIYQAEEQARTAQKIAEEIKQQAAEQILRFKEELQEKDRRLEEIERREHERATRDGITEKRFKELHEQLHKTRNQLFTAEAKLEKTDAIHELFFEMSADHQSQYNTSATEKINQGFARLHARQDDGLRKLSMLMATLTERLTEVEEMVLLQQEHKKSQQKGRAPTFFPSAIGAGTAATTSTTETPKAAAPKVDHRAMLMGASNNSTHHIGNRA